MPLLEESSHRHRIKSAESTDKTVCQARGVEDVRRYDGMTRTRSDPRLRDLRREEYHKRSYSDKWSSLGNIDDMRVDVRRSIRNLDDAESHSARSFSKRIDDKTANKTHTASTKDDEVAYYSSSSSVLSDVRSPELRDYSSNHYSSSRRRVLSPSSLSPCQGVDDKVRDIYKFIFYFRNNV